MRFSSLKTAGILTAAHAARDYVMAVDVGAIPADLADRVHAYSL
jgi:hypothetical protein